MRKQRDNQRATIPGRNGGRLHAGGTPGNAGGTGRPPDEFKAAMRALVTWVDKAGLVQRVLSDTSHPHWLGALKFVTEHGYGRPKETIAHTGEGGGPLTLRVIYEDEDAL